MKIAIKSDVGQRRTVNEDAAGYFLNTQNVPMIVVCDGIGGHNAGDVASAMALSHLGKRWEEESITDTEAAYQWLVKNIQGENDRIFQKANQYRELDGMGTTIVVAVVIGSELLIANVGDSRAYLYRNYQIKQLTEDHTLVQELLKSGEITEEEAKSHPQRNIVTQSLGITLNVQIDFVRVNLKNEDTIFLCSDGLSNMVEDQYIKEILGNYSDVETQAIKAVEAANEAGGRDNITVAIAKYTAREEVEE